MPCATRHADAALLSFADAFFDSALLPLMRHAAFRLAQRRRAYAALAALLFAA